ncbi:patched domain-containing protein 3-like isoform X2 [Bacillus rossius redtenbacheri]|uniref:patched domain-containing protein 3-like isoform X2 n=1 Tax=Bacillus rossius redtenbacheri TaxID=93214 RepID=UPI002FDDCDFC
MSGVRRCLAALSSALPDLDDCFYRLGRLVGRRPLVAMAASVLLLAGASSGLLQWREQADLAQLFLPLASPVREHAAWVEGRFRDDVLFASVIVEADDVLARPVLAAILDIEMAVRSVNVSGHAWPDVCAEYLSWFKDKVPEEFEEEFLEAKKNGVYQDGCVYQSMLKIWTKNGYSEDILPFSQEKILDDVTKAINYKKHKNVLDEIKPLLSQISYDANLRVTGAKATILNWMLKRTVPETPNWELEFVHATMYPNKTLPPGMKIYSVSDRSYYDALREVLRNNIPTMLAGFSVIILYVAVMVSQCSIIKMRLYISLVAVSLVGQSILSSYGFCFYLGFHWGPIHPILPFLLLGVGIDNTFVMVQCLDSVDKEQHVNDVPERIGRTLQKCGVSITVTSLTDILAFSVGMTSGMPFLRSFCLFAATGVLFLYVFGLLFFLSCLTLDEYRIQERRDGCCFQVKPDTQPQVCQAQRQARSFVFSRVAPMLTTLPCKIVICLIALALFSINLWNVFQVEQNFDPMLYLSPSSYPLKYSGKLNQYFPEFGQRAGVYLGEINYFKEKENLDKLYMLLKNDPYINSDTVDFWYAAYQEWFKGKFPNTVIEDEEEMKSYLSEFLLFTKQGQPYIKDLRFDKVPFGNYRIMASKINIQHVQMNTTQDKVKAMESINNIIKQVQPTMSDKIMKSIANIIKQVNFTTPGKIPDNGTWTDTQAVLTNSTYNNVKAVETIKNMIKQINLTIPDNIMDLMTKVIAQVNFKTPDKIMESVASIVKQVNITTPEKIVAFSPEYVPWTANKIIAEELLRNLGLTVAAVATVTALLIRDLRTSLLVMGCVVLTVTDLVGAMHWMGLTVEIFTSVMVLLCTGLSVDFAAHVGYEFTRLRGTRDERAIESLKVIGAAIFHGGFSTFLAFSVLGFSESYLLTTSFKLFTGVVGFGMFHGLILLPVLLSWFGPPAPPESHFQVNCTVLNSRQLKDGGGLLNSCYEENDAVHFKTGGDSAAVVRFPEPAQARSVQNGACILDRSVSAPCLQTG